MKLHIGDAPNPTEGPNHEVADIFQLYSKAFRQHHDLPFWYLKTMQRITYCRTAVMAVIWTNAMNADFVKTPITLAETGTVPNAGGWPKNNGSMTENPSCCPRAIFIRYLRCPICSTRLSSAT